MSSTDAKTPKGTRDFDPFLGTFKLFKKVDQKKYQKLITILFKRISQTTDYYNN